MPRKLTGLAVMRVQPLHTGHTRIINLMIQECETVIIGLGSANKPSTQQNPWSVEERTQMLRNVYGDRIKILPLADLGTTATTNDWVDYVLEKVRKVGLPDPTDYFTGSEADAVWYRERFYDRCLSPGTGQFTIPNTEFKRLLHIKDRFENPVPSATELRTFLEMRSDGWKKWVPSVNHLLVESTYPEQFRVGSQATSSN